MNFTSIDCTEEGDYTFTITGKDVLDHPMVVKDSEPKSYEYIESFIIDKTAPSCDVSFDNNSVVNGMYYTAARTATITIIERSFKGEEPDDVLPKFINVNPIKIIGNDGKVGDCTESN